MYCNARQCAQTCDATTCHMTKAKAGPISSPSELKCSGNGQCCKRFMSSEIFHTECGKGKSCTCTKCSRRQCSTSDLYPPDVISSTAATAIQVFATQSSTEQRTENSQAYLLLISSLLPSPTSSSSSSSSSSLSAAATQSPYTPSPSSSFSSPSITKTSWSLILEVIQNLANDSVSRLNGIDIRRNSSLKEAMRVFEVFTDRFLNVTKPHRSQLISREDENRRESIFEVAIAFEEFALNYGKHHLSGTKSSAKITSQKMVMGIQRGYRQNATDFFLKEEGWQASINISSQEFSENGSVVVGCMYKDLHELLVRNKSIGGETGNSRSLMKKNIACFGVVPKRGRNINTDKNALELYFLFQTIILNGKLLVKRVFATRIVPKFKLQCRQWFSDMKSDESVFSH
ncbi:uncharacterized protein LOC111335122 isoform X2 [Stylophora pistillata]|uniref:uncharacterized protein LOC111335122 isoform X2 n=1 Tax=Stylophora pistillata TaxID=50429 RepID=UPI000C03FF25|nr:uncharacterized protein LOC111335122 isoform X2 [Stylophora pistillata]